MTVAVGWLWTLPPHLESEAASGTSHIRSFWGLNEPMRRACGAAMGQALGSGSCSFFSTPQRPAGAHGVLHPRIPGPGETVNTQRSDSTSGGFQCYTFKFLKGYRESR